MLIRTVLSLLLPVCLTGAVQQGSGQEDKILELGDKLLGEAKSGYEDARSKNSVTGFIEAGFKLEEARIKFIVLQEIGSPEKQKIAADRLRAVNQLSKLIHDGKVAVAGSPADPAAAPEGAPAKPADPAAPANPSPAPGTERPQPKTASEAVQRIPVPEAAKQREAEKMIKDLFKDQYLKKSPADRQALAKSLLEQARKTTDEPAAMWVLYREAQDSSVQAVDVKTAMQAIEETAKVFDIEATSLKSAALSSAGKLAKSPEEFTALADALLKLIDELLAIDQYDAADKAATAALQYAKRSTDQSLPGHAATRAKEVAEAKSRYQGMKRVLETLAKTPEDPGANNEMGQYYCFVKGNWDFGLRFLARGSDATLRGLAAKEIALPTQTIELVALADGWWDLAEKEKSPLRKGQMKSHALSLYDVALPNASGLLKSKIEKRLAEAEEQQVTGGVNLLRLIDPKLDALAGDWTFDGRALQSPAALPSWARLQIPFSAPAEYDLTLVVRAVDSYLGIRLGLPVGQERQCMVVLGGDEGRSLGLEMIDDRSWNDRNPTYASFPNGLRTATIVCSIRKSGLTLAVEGKKLVDWKEPARLSLFGGWSVPNRNSFFLASSSPRVAISQIMLTPITGQGKKLR